MTAPDLCVDEQCWLNFDECRILASGNDHLTTVRLTYPDLKISRVREGEGETEMRERKKGRDTDTERQKIKEPAGVYMQSYKWTYLN